jgi:hypothetical protein
MISGSHRLVVLMVLLGGCSLAMRGVDPGWDHHEEPQCTESHTPVVVDGLTASGLAGLALQAAREDTFPMDLKVSIAAMSIVLALVYTGSAAAGSSKYKNCRSARAAWHASEAIRESRAWSAAAAEPPTEPSGAPGARSASTSNTRAIGSAGAPSPTGYFCASSTTRGDESICMRERTACELAQQASGLPDCMPRKIAWCFDLDGSPQCFGTPRACEAQRATALSTSSPCNERP